MTRRRLTTVLTLTVALCATASVPARALPPIKHVWVLQLENKTYDATFTANKNPYLSRALPAAGSLLRQYYGTSHASLGNYLTQISGQAPNILTQADCPIYFDVTPGLLGTDGQAIGQGCVYPPEIKTLPDQLEAKGLTWKGYMEDMGNDPAREAMRCGAPKLDSRDQTQTATAVDQYAARHNPFVYFHSILDPPGRCAAHVGPLPPLADDLKSIATTPNFSWITPNLCNDAHDSTPCAGKNAKGTRDGSLVAADAFLAKWVPVILSSQAFRTDGLLLITFDESDSADASSCCNQPAGLNTPRPGISGLGGGRTGAIAISPFVRPGSKDDTKYNHYSLLKSLEQIFGIDNHLGYAAAPGLSSFGDTVFNRPGGGPVPLPGQATAARVKLTVRLGASIPTTVGRMRSKLHRGLVTSVTVRGTDRADNPVRVRLVREATHKGGRTLRVASTTPRRLKDGRGRVTLRAARRARSRVRPGRYVLVAESLRKGRVAARARRHFTLKR